jgi:hypothetical protein
VMGLEWREDEDWHDAQVCTAGPLTAKVSLWAGKWWCDMGGLEEVCANEAEAKALGERELRKDAAEIAAALGCRLVPVDVCDRAANALDMQILPGLTRPAELEWLYAAVRALRGEEVCDGD